MSGPTLADPASMTGQYYDGEAINLAGADWVPTVTGKSFARGLFIGGAGNVKVDFLGTSGSGGATAVTLTGVTAGSVIQLAVTKVYNTAHGTTASNITALY